MITMFPGGTIIDGTQIPMDRGEFAAKGLYFVVDPSSQLLKEARYTVKKNTKQPLSEQFHRMQKLAGTITETYLKENESVKDRIYDFLNRNKDVSE